MLITLSVKVNTNKPRPEDFPEAVVTCASVDALDGCDTVGTPRTNNPPTPPTVVPPVKL